MLSKYLTLLLQFTSIKGLLFATTLFNRDDIDTVKSPSDYLRIVTKKKKKNIVSLNPFSKRYFLYVSNKDRIRIEDKKLLFPLFSLIYNVFMIYSNRQKAIITFFV